MSDQPLPPGRARRERMHLPALVALTALMVAGLVAYLSRNPAVDPPLTAAWPASVSTIAGDGTSGGRDGDAARARFSDPFGIAVGADGTIYIADAGDAPRIRRLSADGQVATLAGGARGFADGRGAAARFDAPSGLALDSSGTLYVADTGNNAVRRVAADGTVSTVAGDGVAGDRDGPRHQARFNGPIGIAVAERAGETGATRILVADSYNDRIRAIAADGMVSTLTPSASATAQTVPPRFDTPSGLAVDAAGVIHVADTGNGLIRRIDSAGVVTTTAWASGDGFVRPIGIAAGAAGALHIADERGRIVEQAANGEVRVVAGAEPGFRDGPGAAARFRRPSGIAQAAPGRLVVADSGNALIRAVEATARKPLRLPLTPAIVPGFDAAAFGHRPLLWPVAPMEGPHEVAGTLGEARGSEGSERFHAGIDVRVEQGTPVLAVREGVVASPVSTGDFGALNEWLRIGALTYVHVNVGRTVRAAGRRTREVATPFADERFVPSYDDSGQLVGLRVKRGARFTTGEPIATANRFNHVHLNVGWSGEEHNPLTFRMAHFEDTVPPTIARGGIRVFDEWWQPVTRRAGRRLAVSGRVRLVIDAWDQVDGNRATRRLGLYAAGFEILDARGTPVDQPAASGERLRFDRLAPAPGAARLVYAPGSGIPFYGRRTTRFLYAITSSLRDGVAHDGLWDTSVLPPGPYTVRVRAADVRGNTALANRDLAVMVEPPTGVSAGAGPIR